MKTRKPTFPDFLNYFPEIELPVNLTDDALAVFSKENNALPVAFIREFIHDDDTDEFTEYVPCFRIPNTDNFHALVYWKAQLLSYEYHLLTYTPKGDIISGKVISGTITNGNTIIKSVGTIDEDWIIHIVTGEDDVRNPNYRPEDSKSYTMELLSTGDIIFSLSSEDSSLN